MKIIEKFNLILLVFKPRELVHLTITLHRINELVAEFQFGRKKRHHIITLS